MARRQLCLPTGPKGPGVLLGGRLAQDDLENLFPWYASGEEQCMRRAKWFAAGSSILAWMRHRESAFQVGQPAGLRLTCISGRLAVDRLARRPRSQPCRKAGRLRPRQSTAACWSIAELKERRFGRDPSAARMLICGPGSAVPGDDDRNPVRPGPLRSRPAAASSARRAFG